MKVYYECAPCFLRQTREALDLATSHEDLKMEITEKVVRVVCRDFHRGVVPNVVGTKIHRMIKEDTGNHDPYSDWRMKCNQVAENFLPKIREIMEKEGNSLESYIKAAIVGNVIDFGALGLKYDMDSMVENTLKKALTINHTMKLERKLKKARNVLYLADNVGEIVFDKMLIKKIKEYGMEVTVALKEKPILNDACIEDALDIGLDEVAELVSIGTDSIGIIYEQTSDKFKKNFKDADIIIGKGLGNYEGLTEIDKGDKPVFCLLNAKCNPVAKDIGVNKGDNVVLML